MRIATTVSIVAAIMRRGAARRQGASSLDLGRFGACPL